MKIRERLPEAIGEEIHHCLSCNACRPNCTVNITTNRLQPLTLVRMVHMGLIDELTRFPEIWYCLQCNHCSETCPMTVKPSELVRYLRQEALARGAVTQAAFDAYEALLVRLHRVRRHLVDGCLRGIESGDTATWWDRWAEVPIEPAAGALTPSPSGRAELQAGIDDFVGFPTDLSVCMTCGECSSVCPVALERAVFDPVSIFRRVNYGLQEELLRDPSIWLCLECQSCTAVCAQKVSGHQVIRGLQALAIRKGLVPEDVRMRLWGIHRELYPRFLAEVDRVFGF